MKFAAFVFSVVSAVALSSCCCQTQDAPKLRKMPRNLVPEEAPAQPGTPTAQPGQPDEPVNAPVKVLDGTSK